MGWNWWGQRNPQNEDDFDLNKTMEKSIINKIIQFDWNKENCNNITVQEMIMTENTNDLGDVISPQTSHVLFSEFLKFMFLNYINIKAIYPKENRESKESRASTNKNIFYTGLIAPPYIDLVWRSLFKLKSYNSFCKLIFKGFLVRQDVESLCEPAGFDYKATIELLNQHRDLINPFNNLWPDYSNYLLLSDYQEIRWVTYDCLHEIKQELSKRIEETKSIGIKNTRNIWTDIIEEIIEKSDIKGEPKIYINWLKLHYFLYDANLKIYGYLFYYRLKSWDWIYWWSYWTCKWNDYKCS